MLNESGKITCGGKKEVNIQIEYGSYYAKSDRHKCSSVYGENSENIMHASTTGNANKYARSIIALITCILPCEMQVNSRRPPWI